MVAATEVSVVMCTHNGAEFVAEQVSSILEQTVLPGELIVSDDASTDNTLAIVREAFEAARQTNPLVSAVTLSIHRNKQALGVAKNFETAMGRSAGKIIFLADQDDLWFPHKIEVMMSTLNETEGASFVFGNAALITADGVDMGHSLFDALAVSRRELTGITGSHPFTILVRRNIVTGATVALSRSIFDLAVPFPSGWVHDEWLATVAALSGARFGVTGPLMGYRQHAANQIGVKKRTASIRVGRLTMNGRERNARLGERAHQLLTRSSELSHNASDLRLIRASASFQSARSRFPRFRGIRWMWVIPHIVSARYWRVSNGARDVLRDIVQPL